MSDARPAAGHSRCLGHGRVSSERRRRPASPRRRSSRGPSTMRSSTQRSPPAPQRSPSLSLSPSPPLRSPPASRRSPSLSLSPSPPKRSSTWRSPKHLRRSLSSSLRSPSSQRSSKPLQTSQPPSRRSPPQSSRSSSSGRKSSRRSPHASRRSQLHIRSSSPPPRRHKRAGSHSRCSEQKRKRTVTSLLEQPKPSTSRTVTPPPPPPVRLNVQERVPVHHRLGSTLSHHMHSNKPDERTLPPKRQSQKDFLESLVQIATCSRATVSSVLLQEDSSPVRGVDTTSHIVIPTLEDGNASQLVSQHISPVTMAEPPSNATSSIFMGNIASVAPPCEQAADIDDASNRQSNQFPTIQTPTTVLVDFTIKRLHDYNLMQHFVISLPEMAYLKMEHLKPVLIAKDYNIGLQKGYVFNNPADGGSLMIKSRIHKNEAPLEVSNEKDLAADIVNFLGPVLANFEDRHFVLVLPTIPHFGYINDIFGRRRIWAKFQKRFIGWHDLANSCYSFLLGIQHYIKAVELSGGKLLQLYMHFNNKRLPRQPDHSIGIMNEVNKKIWKDGNINIVSIEPFKTDVSKCTICCLSVTTIPSKCDYYQDEIITSISIYLPQSGGKSIHIPVTPYSLYSVKVLKEKAKIQKNSMDQWMYEGCKPCLDISLAVSHVLTKIQNTSEELGKCGGLLLSLGRNTGAVHFLRAALMCRKENNFFTVIKGFCDMVTYGKLVCDTPNGNVESLRNFYHTDPILKQFVESEKRNPAMESVLIWEMLKRMSVTPEVAVGKTAFTSKSPYVCNMVYRSYFPECREFICDLAVASDTLLPSTQSSYPITLPCTIKGLLLTKAHVPLFLHSHPRGLVKLQTEGTLIVHSPSVNISIAWKHEYTSQSSLKRGDPVALAMDPDALKKLNKESGFENIDLNDKQRSQKAIANSSKIPRYSPVGMDFNEQESENEVELLSSSEDKALIMREPQRQDFDADEGQIVESDEEIVVLPEPTREEIKVVDLVDEEEGQSPKSSFRDASRKRQHNEVESTEAEVEQPHTSKKTNGAIPKISPIFTEKPKRQNFAITDEELEKFVVFDSEDDALVELKEYLKRFCEFFKRQGKPVPYNIGDDILDYLQSLDITSLSQLKYKMPQGPVSELFLIHCLEHSFPNHKNLISDAAFPVFLETVLAYWNELDEDIESDETLSFLTNPKCFLKPEHGETELDRELAALFENESEENKADFLNNELDEEVERETKPKILAQLSSEAIEHQYNQCAKDESTCLRALITDKSVLNTLSTAAVESSVQGPPKEEASTIKVLEGTESSAVKSTSEKASSNLSTLTSTNSPGSSVPSSSKTASQNDPVTMLKVPAQGSHCLEQSELAQISNADQQTSTEKKQPNSSRIFHKQVYETKSDKRVSKKAPEEASPNVRWDNINISFCKEYLTTKKCTNPVCDKEFHGSWKEVWTLHKKQLIEGSTIEADVKKQCEHFGTKEELCARYLVNLCKQGPLCTQSHNLPESYCRKFAASKSSCDAKCGKEIHLTSKLARREFKLSLKRNRQYCHTCLKPSLCMEFCKLKSCTKGTECMGQHFVPTHLKMPRYCLQDTCSSVTQCNKKHVTEEKLQEMYKLKTDKLRIENEFRGMTYLSALSKQCLLGIKKKKSVAVISATKEAHAATKETSVIYHSKTMFTSKQAITQQPKITVESKVSKQPQLAVFATESGICNHYGLKEELCSNFLNQICHLGSNCKDSHNLPIPFCKAFLKGTICANKCLLDLHKTSAEIASIYKKQLLQKRFECQLCFKPTLCPDYLTNNICERGKQCGMQHKLPTYIKIPNDYCPEYMRNNVCNQPSSCTIPQHLSITEFNQIYQWEAAKEPIIQPERTKICPYVDGFKKLCFDFFKNGHCTNCLDDHTLPKFIKPYCSQFLRHKKCDLSGSNNSCKNGRHIPWTVFQAQYIQTTTHHRRTCFDCVKNINENYLNVCPALFLTGFCPQYVTCSHLHTQPQGVNILYCREFLMNRPCGDKNSCHRHIDINVFNQEVKQQWIKLEAEKLTDPKRVCDPSIGSCSHYEYEIKTPDELAANWVSLPVDIRKQLKVCLSYFGGSCSTLNTSYKRCSNGPHVYMDRLFEQYQSLIESLKARCQPCTSQVKKIQVVKPT